MDGQHVVAGSHSGRSQRGIRPGARPFGKGWDQGNFRPLVRPRGIPRGSRVQVWARKGDPCLGSPPPQLFHPSLHVRLPEVSELPEEQRQRLCSPGLGGLAAPPHTHREGQPGAWPTASPTCSVAGRLRGSWVGSVCRVVQWEAQSLGRSWGPGPVPGGDPAVRAPPWQPTQRGNARAQAAMFPKIDKVQGLRSASRGIGLTADQWGAGSPGGVCWEERAPDFHCAPRTPPRPGPSVWISEGRAGAPARRH